MSLLSDIYVNPVLTFFFAPLMIAALVISIVLFVKRKLSRKNVLICMFFLGYWESLLSFLFFWLDGMFIGFITLTCFGVLAVLNYSGAARYRILVGALFVVLGGLELILPIYIAFKVNLLANLRAFAWFMLMFSLVLASLIGGIAILIAAVKNHSQAQ